MLCNFRLYMRYVESKRNHLDGPSRGYGLGLAPQWVIDEDEEKLREAFRAAVARRAAA